MPLPPAKNIKEDKNLQEYCSSWEVSTKSVILPAMRGIKITLAESKMEIECPACGNKLV
jgi:predicted RNA-binding Zn-ribbon protein involved in translation (DUF1610 family)